MKKVLIVIDMQNDFVDGVLGTKEAKSVVPKIVEKMKSYEGADNIVLFTKDTHYDNYKDTQEGKFLPVEHCIINTPGWSIVKDIHDEFKHGNYATISSDKVINGRILKPTFGSRELANIVADLNPGEIELVGVCTDICVMSNAILLKTALPETLITVDASCCAGVTPESHQAALTTMKMCQINVIGE